MDCSGEVVYFKLDLDLRWPSTVLTRALVDAI